MAFLKKEKKPSMVKQLARGVCTGFFEAAICYPTEFVKTQLQLQSNVSKLYSGMFDCAVKNIRTNGPLSLYRGSAPLIFGASVKQSARWMAYGQVSNYFRRDDGSIALYHNMIAGFCAGTIESMVAVTPIETVKTRVTDDLRLGSKKYINSLDASIKILKAEGPQGIYRGLLPTILKHGTDQMLRFPLQLFYFILIFGNDAKRKTNPLMNGLCGAAAGGTSVLITMPQDIVKTRMQGEAASRLYKSTFDCAKQVLEKEGILFFYTGIWPRFIRVCLGAGMTFTFYPLMSNLI